MGGAERRDAPASSRDESAPDAERRNDHTLAISLLGAALGALPSVLLGANSRLGGPLFVLLVLLGSGGGIALLYAIRSRAHRLPAAVSGIVLLVLAFGGALASYEPKADPPPPDSRPRARAPSVPPLAVAVEPVEPGRWKVAFADQVGLPSPGSGWRELIAGGGVDVGGSRYQLRLSNRSSRQLAVTAVTAVVERADPAPIGALASGGRGTWARGELDGLLAAESSGATAALTPVAEARPAPLPVLLDAGAMEVVELSVRTRSTGLVVYRFEVRYATASAAKEHTVRDRTSRRISGATGSAVAYAHRYERDGSPSACEPRQKGWREVPLEECSPAPSETFSEPAPAASPPETIFHTPGEVACRINDRSVACTVASTGTTFWVTDGRGRADLDDDLPRGAGEAVDWGASVRRGDFRCQVPEANEPLGVRCENLATGHGFVASRLSSRMNTY